jgi:hypothetical protein
MNNSTHRLIDLPRICDLRGNLSVIERSGALPFAIERAYWIYDVPGGVEREGHAFKRQEEFIVAISGSFDVVLHDGEREHRITLNRSYYGLYVAPMTWRRLDNFSTNSLCLVISSRPFEEDDYIRDFDAYCVARRRAHRFEPLLPAQVPQPELPKLSEVIPMPQVHYPQGKLTAVNNRLELPYDIRRVYYLYDVPAGAERGGHSHRATYEYLVAASGSFDVVIEDALGRRTVHLDRPYEGLLITPGTWRELRNFSGGAICMVLASAEYEEADYVRDYDEFVALNESERELLDKPE